ncbi:hypothetical protein ACIRPQ_08060 [Streptomyces sp. NPDC101213]|uniref:hypothetical protein n=1 Tax=Streptomyces sp. NPDC101213 TaxID=3366130 RepID=UPI0037F286A4
MEPHGVLVVSGPTVVGPLPAFVRPADRLQTVLSWEGSLVDPVGAILGALVFAAVLDGGHDKSAGYQVVQFLISVGVGLAGAAVGCALLWLLLTRFRPGGTLGTTRNSSDAWPTSRTPCLARVDTAARSA